MLCFSLPPIFSPFDSLERSFVLSDYARLTYETLFASEAVFTLAFMVELRNVKS